MWLAVFATHTIPDMRSGGIVVADDPPSWVPGTSTVRNGERHQHFADFQLQHCQLAESQRARERETHSPLTPLPSPLPPPLHTQHHHHHHHHHPPYTFWLMLPLRFKLFLVAPCQTTGIEGFVWYACNRCVAHVQQFHVPLFVVFSTNVFVGHVCRCPSVSFVPTERFRVHALRSWGEHFEGFGVHWVSAFGESRCEGLRACAGRRCFWVLRV